MLTFGCAICLRDLNLKWRLSFWFLLPPPPQKQKTTTNKTAHPKRHIKTKTGTLKKCRSFCPPFSGRLRVGHDQRGAHGSPTLRGGRGSPAAPLRPPPPRGRRLKRKHPRGCDTRGRSPKTNRAPKTNPPPKKRKERKKEEKRKKKGEIVASQKWG